MVEDRGEKKYNKGVSSIDNFFATKKNWKTSRIWNLHSFKKEKTQQKCVLNTLKSLNNEFYNNSLFRVKNNSSILW
jgi:hypothetical protein